MTSRLMTQYDVSNHFSFSPSNVLINSFAFMLVYIHLRVCVCICMYVSVCVLGGAVRSSTRAGDLLVRTALSLFFRNIRKLVSHDSLITSLWLLDITD